MAERDDIDEGECCDGCGGDLLPLRSFEPRTGGDGQTHRLCEICASSYVVSAWRVGTPMSAEAKDVLIGNHILLAEIRSIARTGE